MNKNHQNIDLSFLKFVSPYSEEKAKQVVAIVAKVNPNYKNNINAVIQTVEELACHINGTVTSASTGGIILEKFGEWYQLEIHNCIYSDIYNTIFPKSKKII